MMCSLNHILSTIPTSSKLGQAAALLRRIQEGKTSVCDIQNVVTTIGEAEQYYDEVDRLKSVQADLLSQICATGILDEARARCHHLQRQIKEKKLEGFAALDCNAFGKTMKICAELLELQACQTLAKSQFCTARDKLQNKGIRSFPNIAADQI